MAADEKTVVKQDPGKWKSERINYNHDLFFDEEKIEEKGVVALYHCPGDTHYSNGTRGLSMNCPMLIATGFMANEEDVMKKISEVLTEHFPS